MRIDFHSHILPGMDDGAKDIDESLKMLKTLSDDKVDTVILTPHFYRSDENISAFLSRREEAYKILSEASAGIRCCPEFVLGAEVYFHPSLYQDEDLPKLCISGTDYLLLELPFEEFSSTFYNDYATFVNSCNCKIVLAHIERYLSFGNKREQILHLFDYGRVLCQMNCSSLAQAGFFTRKKLLPMIKGGIISAIGTDAHNTQNRPPEYGKAENVISSFCGREAFEEICARSEKILQNATVGSII